MLLLLKAPFVLFITYFMIFILTCIDPDFPIYSANYFYYMISALSLFSISYFISYRLTNKKIRIFEKDFLTPRKAINLYHIFCVIGLMVYLINYYAVVGEDWFALYKVRSALTENLQKPLLPFHILFNPFLFTCIPLIITYYACMSKKDITLFIFYTFIFVILSVSRSGLFVIVFLSLLFFLRKKGYLDRKIFLIILSAAASLYGFFIALGVMLGKSPTTMSFTFYLISPTHALDAIINEINLNEFKDLFLTFRPIHPLLVYLGIIKQHAQLLPYYTNLSFSGRSVNVYTMFGVYIIDYGKYGSLFITSLLGAMSGIIEKLSFLSYQNLFLKFICSLNLTCLILSCFYDYYLSSGFVFLAILVSYIFFPKSDEIQLKHN